MRATGRIPVRTSAVRIPPRLTQPPQPAPLHFAANPLVSRISDGNGEMLHQLFCFKLSKHSLLLGRLW